MTQTDSKEKKVTTPLSHMQQTDPSDKILVTAKQLSAYQMLQTGWTQQQVAQSFGVDRVTVYRWTKDIENHIATLPSIQAAKDRLQTMIPRCVDVFDDILSGIDKRLASEIASKILNSNAVVTDRKNVVLVDDTNATDDELISEAERLIAGMGKE